MAETAGAFFYFEWEMRLMEWLQDCIGGEGVFCIRLCRIF